jgi:hypothetical protein
LRPLLFLLAGLLLAPSFRPLFLCNNACPADLPLHLGSPPNENPQDIPFRKNALKAPSKAVSPLDLTGPSLLALRTSLS